MTLRARSVKAELNDIEGLGFKLEERQQDILQLKKNLKMKVSSPVGVVGERERENVISKRRSCS